MLPRRFRDVLHAIGFTKSTQDGEIEFPDADIQFFFNVIDRYVDHDHLLTFSQVESFCRDVKRGKKLLEPETAEERRERLGDADEIEARRKREKDERQRLEDETRVAERAARHAAASEAAKQRHLKGQAQMEEWFAQNAAEHENQYQVMLAAALALLPQGMPRAADDGASGMGARQAWLKYTSPRVERTGRRPMAFNARPDSRPASVAFPQHWELGSVRPAPQIGVNNPSTASVSTSRPQSARLVAPVHRSAPASPRSNLADGTRRVILTVRRIAPNLYTFVRLDPGGRLQAGGPPMVLRPPRGLVCDADTVEGGVRKLVAAFSTELPTHLPFQPPPPALGSPRLVQQRAVHYELRTTSGAVLSDQLGLASQVNESNRQPLPANRPTSSLSSHRPPPSPHSPRLVKQPQWRVAP